MSDLAKVLDKDGNDLGYGRPLKDIHRNPQLFCEAVHVWIYDPGGWVLLQKRSKDHPSDGGMWDISAAGHIDFGEEPETAAVREVKEELGLTVSPTELTFGDRRYVQHMTKSTYPGLGDYLHNEYVVFYFLELNRNNAKIKLEDGEVDKFEWLPFKTFIHETTKKGQVKYVPFDTNYYSYVISELKKVIGQSSGGFSG